MKKILIIHTGGTISMKEDEETGAVRPDETHPLHDVAPPLASLADIYVEELFHLPSPHMTPQEMLQLRNRIEEKIANEQIEGIVVTHGTDTLEETAYFLDLTARTDVPIVVTGAMRSSNEIGADGLYNLISSVKVAISDEARGKGVLVVLNDEIHTAKNVTKTHTSNIVTFQSPQYGPIGIVTKRGVFFHHAPTKRTTRARGASQSGGDAKPAIGHQTTRAPRARSGARWTGCAAAKTVNAPQERTTWNHWPSMSTWSRTEGQGRARTARRVAAATAGHPPVEDWKAFFDSLSGEASDDR